MRMLMRLSQGRLVYSTEAISLQNIQLKERVTELELQLKEAKKSPLDQPESSKSTSHFSGELDVLSEEQFNLLCNRVSARVKGLDMGLYNSSQLSKDVTLSNATHRPTQVHNASDLYSDSMLTAQPSTSHAQGSRKGSSRAFQHVNMFNGSSFHQEDQDESDDREEEQIEEVDEG